MTDTLDRLGAEAASGSHASYADMRRQRPLDILIIASEVQPVVPGISPAVRRLADGLQGRGHHVEVFSPGYIPVLKFRGLRISSFLAHWPGIARRLGQFDVVNLHGPAPAMSDVFLNLSGRLPEHARASVVYTHHAPLDVHGLNPLAGRYNKRHDLLTMRADRIVTSSAQYAGHYRRRYGPQVRVIPWGMDVSSSRPARERHPAEPLRILFAGPMASGRGIETLLMAVAGASRLRLTLADSGPNLCHYQRLATRLGAENVDFLSGLSEAELRDQYTCHDVAVLPSVPHAEGFGLALLEGMAAGCVPVASDLPGAGDLAGRVGVLVPPGDPVALRQALSGLAEDDRRLADLQADSWRAAQALSWERCVAAYEGVLFDAVRGRFAQLHGVAALPELHQGERW